MLHAWRRWCLRGHRVLRCGRNDVVTRAALAEISFTLECLFVVSCLSQLHTPITPKTSFNQTLRCRIDVADVSILNEGFQSKNNLRAFIWHVAHLSFRE